jgi:inosine-uridine nucleoside N-ribohydrolase
MPIPVILDTDIGSDIDDTWALAMLLRCPELDLKLVLTDTADTVYRARLAAKFLEVSGRADVPVGVGLRFGAASEFQKPWVSGYALSDYPGPVYEDGIQAAIDIIKASAEPVTIIAIAPAPNLGRILEIAPEIAPTCRLAGMFGSVDRGYGDGSAAIAETNVRESVAAARAVFAAPWLEAVITPLDTCDRVILSGERFRRVASSADPMLVALMENYRVWAPLVSWMTVDYESTRSTTLFDTVAVYLAYGRDLLEIETMRLEVTDDGMTVQSEVGHPIGVAIRWRDLDAFRDHLTERLLS